jgi:hypothetical protein
LYNNMPGWTVGDVGYHGDDGRVHCESEMVNYAETYSTGDIIGCGFNIGGCSVYFTKNSRWLGKFVCDSYRIIRILP